LYSCPFFISNWQYCLGRKSHFKHDVFEFNPVLEGTDVINDFIIKNKGTAPLEILNVEPG
jgi:hypothetical protein